MDQPASPVEPPPPSNKETQQSHLLRLPKEIRNIIYHHLFTTDSNWIRLDTASALDAPLFYDCCSPLDDSHALQLYGLILSCRQLYAETIALYYSSTTFYFYNVNAAMRRIARMPAKYREALRDVRACLSPRNLEEARDLNANETNRSRHLESAKENKLNVLLEGLRREGIGLSTGVLRTGSPPPELDGNGGEFAEVTELFGRGPTPARWHGMGDRPNLRRAWTLRTYRRTHELTRYSSIMKHAVEMGSKGERMKCWAEGEGMDI